jgi:hypothetical protein
MVYHFFILIKRPLGFNEGIEVQKEFVSNRRVIEEEEEEEENDEE